MAFPTGIRLALTGIVGKMILWLWAKSVRIEVIGGEEYSAIRKAGKPSIVIVWHGRIFLAPYFFRQRGIMALVSPSQDGEIVVQIVRRWGFDVSRGSSSHSVIRAWSEMKEKLAGGGEILIVPDGPRGPARILKPGCLKLAQQTGAPLIPFTFAASRRKVFGSWDRFVAFYPFARVRIILGKPLYVDPLLEGDALEDERRRIEQMLTSLDDEADAYFGHGCPERLNDQRQSSGRARSINHKD